MFKSKRDLYRKYICFLKGIYSKNVELRHVATEYRTFLAHLLYSDIKSLLRKQTLLLDLGGKRGEYCKVLSSYGFECVNIDVEKQENILFLPMVVADGQKMPFRDQVFNIVLCRAVLEHIPPTGRQKILCELHRTLKKNGVGYVSIPPWLNPHGGHAITPFHILPFKLAIFLTHLFLRRRIKAKSREELGFYPIMVWQMFQLIRKHGFKIVCCQDVLLRNHFLTKIPFVREFAIPHLAFQIVKVN